ncbi:hypothetical protein J6590_054130 [Homalodisca vitripennis]|nr:hypothetical protein J6590_054130 [Homalodisca vitripennis]
MYIDIAPYIYLNFSRFAITPQRLSNLVKGLGKDPESIHSDRHLRKMSHSIVGQAKGFRLEALGRTDPESIHSDRHLQKMLHSIVGQVKGFRLEALGRTAESIHSDRHLRKMSHSIVGQVKGFRLEALGRSGGSGSDPLVARSRRPRGHRQVEHGNGPTCGGSPREAKLLSNAVLRGRDEGQGGVNSHTHGDFSIWYTDTVPSQKVWTIALVAFGLLLDKINTKQRLWRKTTEHPQFARLSLRAIRRLGSRSRKQCVITKWDATLREMNRRVTTCGSAVQSLVAVSEGTVVCDKAEVGRKPNGERRTARGGPHHQSEEDVERGGRKVGLPSPNLD